MWTLGALIWLIGSLVWARAVRANSRTSLIFSVIWGWFAWSALIAALIAARPDAVYAALTLVACAGVSVLGARRPGAAAWQFVVAGLACILLLPIAEGVLTGAAVQLSGMRTAFLIGVLAILIANYLPTRLGLAAVCLAIAAALALLRVTGLASPDRTAVGHTALACSAAAPAIAWLCLRARRDGRTPSARLWLDFRDRFGGIWSLRVIDQFNRAASNSGWSVRLTWTGFRGEDAPELFERLAALVSRFGVAAR